MIGGIRFAIVVEKLDDGDYGRMLFDERKILISPTVTAKAKTLHETLRHEVFHASMYVSGMAYLEKYEDEAITRAADHIFFPAWSKLEAQLRKL